MSKDKPNLNELTGAAAGIRVLKDLKQIILQSDENLNRDEFFCKIDQMIGQLNAIGTGEHIDEMQGNQR